LKRILRQSALWVPVALYGAGVYYLSSLSHVAVAGRLPDYLTHPVEYAGLTLLIIRALNGGLTSTIRWPHHFGAVGMAILYAISDEIHQLHVPRRTASLKDVLSDTLGAVLAVGVAELIQRARQRPRYRAAIPVILYTRRDCHFCHEAGEILSRISRQVPLSVTVVDVDEGGTAVEFAEDVPVIVAAGVKISKLRPDEQALRRRLTRMSAPAG